MAIVVTDELRQAVYDDDCVRLGHDLNLRTAVAFDPAATDVRGPDGQLPHILCRRCGRAWLVVEDPGASYTDAVTKMRDRLKDPGSLTPKPRTVR